MFRPSKLRLGGGFPAARSFTVGKIPAFSSNRGWPTFAVFAKVGIGDFNVWSECKRAEKLRYMHRNP
jgi:hypothetical protein